MSAIAIDESARKKATRAKARPRQDDSGSDSLRSAAVSFAARLLR